MGYPRIGEKVYNYLKEHAQQRFTPKEIAKATGASPSGVLHAAVQMFERGKAIKVTKIHAHRHEISYTRPPHNKRHDDAPAIQVQVKVPVPDVSEVTLTIPALGGPVQMTLAAARKLYDELHNIFGGKHGESQG